MQSRIHTGRLALWGLLLAASATGCHTIQPSTPLTVNVRDAETQAPIPGATVRVCRFGAHSADHDVSFTTGPDGAAKTRLPPPEAGGVMVEIEAPGYLTSQKPLPRDIATALASAKPFHPYSGSPLAVNVDVFAGPRPTAELVLPVGFRGLLKTEIRVNTDHPWPAGQRRFSYNVPPNGNPGPPGIIQDAVVRVDGPPVFNHGVAGPDIVAKYADGTPIPKEGKSEEVALRWIRRDGNDVYFAVGTNADLSQINKLLGLTTPANSKSEGDPDRRQGSSGGGRHGGHGGGRGRGE